MKPVCLSLGKLICSRLRCDAKVNVKVTLRRNVVITCETRKVANLIFRTLAIKYSYIYIYKYIKKTAIIDRMARKVVPAVT